MEDHGVTAKETETYSNKKRVRDGAQGGKSKNGESSIAVPKRD